ncbi:hypothetical protein GQ457_13G029630 [Hibiscus cannabinus]
MKTLCCLIQHLLFLLSCFLSLVLSFSPSNTHLPKHHCVDDQRSPLLQLQNHLYYAHADFTFSSKLELWDPNTDCCSWEGVSCDSLGHVIGLDLSFKNLSGSFHSIFHLHRLHRLNLAGNNFNTTLLSYGFDKLPHLTHLNLSNSCFHGQIPMEMSNLTRLVSLDLSRQEYCYWRNDDHHYYYDYDYPTLKLEKPNLKTLVKNLKFLMELYLDEVDISSESSKWCETTSLSLPNLQVLSLSDCGLEGPLCPSLSTLPFLSKLVLDRNPISYLPPNFLEISSRLVSLSLMDCNLSGHFPTEILLLPKIQSIDISWNYQLMGQLPEFPSNNALRSLSLSYTNFNGKLPESIGNLKFLSDLAIVGCSFFGSIPSSIENLTHLVNLGLSVDHFSGNFLTKLFLLPKIQSIAISFSEKHVGQSLEFPSNNALRSLKLFDANFSGKLSESISNLKFLTDLTLVDCNFVGSIPSSIANLSHLVNLDLSINHFSGSIPSSLFTLPSLKVLSLGKNQLVGKIDEFPNASSSMIEELYLGYNYLSGALPKSILQHNNLRALDLSNMSLFIDGDNGSLADFSKLESLRLRSCNLTEFPEFIKTLDKLVILDLSNNHIHGVVPDWLWKTSLVSVNLSFNPIDFPKQLVVPLGDANFSSPMLRELLLGSCNISVFPEVLRSSENLEVLDLSNNRISGAIPSWVWKKSLSRLYLSNNQLSSLDQLLPSHSLTSSPICNMSQLWDFDASHNNLSGQLPNCLGNMSPLESFDASHNNLSGQIPNCLGNMSALSSLNLQGNKLSGIMPKFSKANQLRFLKVGENKLKGQLPRSLAECTQLTVLDVGNNMMNDTFPFWLEKLSDLAVLILRENMFYGQIKHLKHKISFPALDVLDIASNQFSGKLSVDFLQATQLRSLKIGANKLEGKLPSSLANCNNLEVLDLGNNMIHDTFPFWLEKLPSLKVLILRGNRFYGTITRVDTKHGFPKLHILDIASNNFSGALSIKFLQSLKAMMQLTNDDKANLEYIGEQNNIVRSYYQDSVTIVNKGLEMFYEKVLTILTCLDVSNNSFHGRIPEEIQILRSLRVLNLSHNSFCGNIPSALDNLKDLESLDLSQNSLSGKIPPQLASLTFLEVLDLSYNQLEGSIPQSNQFDTFSNDSYRGNPKLCGTPLSRKCNEVGLPKPPSPFSRKDEEKSWLDVMSTWQIALVGYVSGLVAGICIGYTVLHELGNKWVGKFKKYGKGNRRRTR